MPHTFTTRTADENDLSAILAVQHRAFTRVAVEFGIEPGVLPPLQEDVARLDRLIADGMRFFVAVDATGSVVGSVRGELRGATVEIGRLVVDDGWERRGVASALMERLETSFPQARRFELFTGANATGPLALYRSRGYSEIRREAMPGVELVWLEKCVGPDASHP